MSSIAEFSGLPRELKTEILDLSGEKNIFLTCKEWGQVAEENFFSRFWAQVDRLPISREEKTYIRKDLDSENQKIGDLFQKIFFKFRAFNAENTFHEIIRSHLSITGKLLKAFRQGQKVEMEVYKRFLRILKKQYPVDPNAMKGIKNIKDFQKFILEKFGQIQTLSLHGQYSFSAAPVIGNLTSLTKLHLSRNKIQFLPFSLSGLSQLSSLNLSKNQMAVWPENQPLPPNLEDLDLAENELSELARPIADAGSLKKLYLQNNKFSSFPLEVTKLSSLVYLDLSKNCLQEIPPEIGNMQQLTYLNLSGAHLYTVAAELGKLKNLRMLDLRDNFLTTLPAELSKLPFFPLLQGNPLVYLPSQLMKHAPEDYKKYVFQLDEDLSKIEKLLFAGDDSEAYSIYEDLPARLKMIVHEAVYVFFSGKDSEFTIGSSNFGKEEYERNPRSEKVLAAIGRLAGQMRSLQTARDALAKAETLKEKSEALKILQNFPLEGGLFKQQVAEAILCP